MILFKIIRKLGMGQLTGGEVLFLVRRLQCPAHPAAWSNLGKTYGLDESSLRDLQRVVLRRLSFEGLTQVESWLDGWAGDDYINQLTHTERVNLRLLVDEAISLQTPSSDYKQARPAPAPLLAGDEKEQLAILQELPRSHPSLGFRPEKVGQSSRRANGQVHSLPPQSAGRIPLSQPPNAKAVSTIENDPVLLSCPFVIVNHMTQPERFLEELYKLYGWLSGSSYTVNALYHFMANQGYRLNYNNIQKALDFLYALGIIAPMTSSLPHDSIQLTLSANQNVSQFRRACAEKFTQRIKGNAVLLAAIDYLDCAPFDQIKRVAFGNVPIADAISRMMVWEAFGIVQRQKKDSWKITQAGRALVASLPPVQLITANELEPAPRLTNNDDWLDVL